MRTIIIILITVMLFSCASQKNNGHVYEIRQDILYLNLNGKKKPLLDFKTSQFLDSVSIKERKKIEKFLKKKKRKFKRKNNLPKFR